MERARPSWKRTPSTQKTPEVETKGGKTEEKRETTKATVFTKRGRDISRGGGQSSLPAAGRGGGKKDFQHRGKGIKARKGISF